MIQQSFIVNWLFFSISFLKYWQLPGVSGMDYNPHYTSYGKNIYMCSSWMDVLCR